MLVKFYIQVQHFKFHVHLCVEMKKMNQLVDLQIEFICVIIPLGISFFKILLSSICLHFSMAYLA